MTLLQYPKYFAQGNHSPQISFHLQIDPRHIVFICAKLYPINHILLFIFVIIYINNIYELYLSPVTGIFENSRD